MNIGGRIIQTRNIFVNETDSFFAKYKGHEIHSNIFKRNDRANDEFTYTIVKLKPRDNTIICAGILQRCSIRDVVVHALNEAKL